MRTLRIAEYTILSALALFLGLNSFATTVYVDANNPSPAWPHTSWESAATTIQDAVDVAPGGASVLVTNGNYILTSEIAVTESIRIESVNGPYETIVNGNGAYRGFNLGSNDCVVSGFTVTNCNAGTESAANNGGGFLCLDNTPIITNCVITANVGRNGGGLRMGTAYNCIISGNQTSWSGAGGQYTDMNNCLVADNSAGFRGGGVAHGNLLNCTIVGNYASGDGNGLFMCSATNSIIYYNNGEDVYWESDPYYQSQIGYSCGSDLVHGGLGNTTAVPEFVDAAGGDYRLRSSSPCIDTGINSAAPSDPDLDGNPRIQNSVVDMGAYEYYGDASAPGSGLIAYYPFDVDATDQSGNGNDGTVFGAEWVEHGVVGGAYSFDGVDDYIGLGHRPSLEVTTYTIAAWFRLADINPEPWNANIILRYAEGGGYEGAYYNLYFHDDYDRLYFNYVSSYWEREYGTSFSVDKWHHVAVTQSGRFSQMYLDGILVATNEFDHPPVSSLINAEGYIGGLANTSHHLSFDGLIDEVRIYNRVLNVSEIQTLFAVYDNDSDGVPDYWEREHFGDIDSFGANDDPDKDGYVNSREFEKGTDPNAFDHSPIRVVPIMGSLVDNVLGFEVMWHSIDGVQYQVQSKSSLDSDVWTNVGSTVTGDNEGKSVAEILQPGSVRIYRVLQR